MFSLAWLTQTSKFTERVKIVMGVRSNFSRGVCSVNILRIFFRLLTLQCKRMFTKRFTVSTPQENAPWKHALHSHLIWNLFQVELYTNLPQRCTFCHPLQILLNWRIFTQLYPKWTWTINKYDCGSLISLCWLNRTPFWNLLSELFSTLRLSEMLFLFINFQMSIFESTFYK